MYCFRQSDRAIVIQEPDAALVVVASDLAAVRPAARQRHDDFATYLTELAIGLFDGLQGALEPFQALADPTTVRRALLS